jgi:hypothetical protein
VTLTAAAKATIEQQVKDFADWFQRSGPSLVQWETLQADNPLRFHLLMTSRLNDWRWFANEFITFVQKKPHGRRSIALACLGLHESQISGDFRPMRAQAAEFVGYAGR